MPKKKVNWNNGAIFAIPLKDGTYSYGQIVDLMMANVVYCTFFSLRTNSLISKLPNLTENIAISCLAITREQLDYNAWPIIGESKLILTKNNFKNEEYANNGYIGAKIYDAAIAEDFLNSFNCLAPWDDLHDPEYMDKLLISPEKKPNKLLYIK